VLPRQTAGVTGRERWILAIILAGWPVGGRAEPASEPETPTEDTPAEAPAEPAGEQPAISDATWSALQGKQVRIETPQGPRQGELASVSDDEVVLIEQDGRASSFPKRDATEVRVVSPPASTGAMPTTPPPREGPAETPAEPEEPLDPKEARKQKRKERRENREHALIGAMTAHGASYAHWRGDGVNAGHAAYAMDWGIGVNPSPKFGMYALGGGLLGAKIDDKSIRANYGRLAFMFAFGGKWYFTMFGAGVGFSRLRFPTDELQKDVGLALPIKIFGKVPLPKKLYLGIGLSYDLGIVRGFGRAVNGIGGQIVFGRW
jgi:hypothetical protein